MDGEKEAWVGTATDPDGNKVAEFVVEATEADLTAMANTVNRMILERGSIAGLNFEKAVELVPAAG